VDIGPRLVDLARQRLPHWADRIQVGDALTWVPQDGRRFTYVHLLLDYVLPARRGELLRHALDRLVDRRLLVSYYTHDEEQTARGLVGELGFEIAGGSGDTVWIDR
jgi:spermidine synthase